jgi:hypothetical protein
MSGPGTKEARKRWAALIKQVYEVDPLRCSQCGGEMKIIAFIESHQGEVIETLHCAKRTALLRATHLQGLGSPSSGIAGCGRRRRLGTLLRSRSQ